jgi:hypothetical protein
MLPQNTCWQCVPRLAVKVPLSPLSKTPYASSHSHGCLPHLALLEQQRDANGSANDCGAGTRHSGDDEGGADVQLDDVFGTLQTEQRQGIDMERGRSKGR